MKVLNGFLLLVAIGMFGFGLLIITGGAISFFDPQKSDPLGFTLVMVTLLGIAPCVGGLFLGLRALRRLRAAGHEVEERFILQMAAANGGKVTVAEVAAGTRLDSHRAQQILEALHVRGLAEMEVTRGGSIVYRFHGFVSPEEKQQAIGYEEDQ